MKNPTVGLVLIISCLLIATATAAADAENTWYQSIRKGRETLTKFRFYVHDLKGAYDNATVYTITNSSISVTSGTGFGQINVFDDKITTGPEFTSQEVGRAQGFTLSADLHIRGLTMNLNFFLSSGKYNGSTISVVGRNQIADAERELPVVGGSRSFRYSTGYALGTTYGFYPGNYAVIIYDVYVSTFRNKFDVFTASS